MFVKFIPFHYAPFCLSLPSLLKRWFSILQITLVSQDVALMLILANSWCICRKSRRLQPPSTLVCQCKVLGLCHGLLGSEAFLLLGFKSCAYGYWRLQIFVKFFCNSWSLSVRNLGNWCTHCRPEGCCLRLWYEQKGQRQTWLKPGKVCHAHDLS